MLVLIGVFLSGTNINPFTVNVIYVSDNLQQLTHFKPMLQYFTPWKHQKTEGFLTFSGDKEMEHRLIWVGQLLQNTAKHLNNWQEMRQQ